MAADVDALGVAAEARGVLAHPGDTAAYLCGHDAEIAARFVDVVEVEGDVVRAGRDEHFRREAVILGRAELPSAAVDEHEPRRVRRLAAVDVELLDLARPIGDALRGADARAHGLAVACQ